MRKESMINTDAWQSIYCSVMLIVVAFFVFLVSSSITDTQKMRSFQEQYRTDSPTASKTEKEGPRQTKEGDDLIKGQLLAQISASLNRTIQQGGYGGAIMVERVIKGLKLRFESEVLFDAGETQLKGALFPLLKEISSLAKERNLGIRIEGHTDNQPIKSKKYPSNWELSAARAVYILKHFLEIGTIPAERVSAAGFGEYRPIAENDTPEGRNKNRRVDIYLDLPVLTGL